MRWTLLGGLIGLVTLACGESAAQAPKAAGWLKDYETAKTTAARSGKPMMLVFR